MRPARCRVPSERSPRGARRPCFHGWEQPGRQLGLLGEPPASHSFSARPCIVGEWSPWSGCAGSCKPMARVRRREVRQEPRNGGEPCPALEERAGCLEYSTRQGQACGHAFGTEVCTAGKAHALQGGAWARTRGARAMLDKGVRVRGVNVSLRPIAAVPHPHSGLITQWRPLLLVHHPAVFSKLHQAGHRGLQVG